MDSLDRKIYAEKIAEELEDHYNAQKNNQESDSMVFAISGKWGEGKTVLLDLLEPSLVKKDFSVIRFNPWQYSQEDVSLKRSFLRIVKEKLNSNVDLEDLYFDKSRTTIDWRPFLKQLLEIVFTIAFLVYIVLPAIFGYAVGEWSQTVNTFLKNFWGSGVGGVIFSVLIIPVLIKVITVSSRKAQITTAEEFDAKFKDLLEGKKKVVIFVDDLDRCTSSTVKIVLDSLKTFFYHKECSYVITGDHTVIERYAAEELNPNKKEPLTGKDLEEGRRFLKKLFNVYWRLPLATPKKFKEFITQQIQKSSIVLNEVQDKNIKTFLLDDLFFERNPRHVKRFIVSLKFALQSVNLQERALDESEKNGNGEEDISEQKNSLKEITDNPDLLTKVLLIQEKFYSIYEKLVLHPEDIIKHENALRDGSEPATLTIHGKNIISEILEQDNELLKSYTDLIVLEPQFTNSDNGIVFDPTNFFSFSGATGLPSLKGPDEANFVRYLKSGQLEDRLGNSLEVAPTEKRTRLSQRALQAFGESVDLEKAAVVRESLKISSRLDEWATNLAQWKKYLFSLPPEQQKPLMEYLWRAVLIKSPAMVSAIKKEVPAKMDSFWIVFEEFDVNLLHKEVQAQVRNILIEDIQARPPLPKGVEIYLSKFNDPELEKYIDEQLTDPASCKLFMDNLVVLGLADGKFAEIVKKKLSSLLKGYDQLNWTVPHKEYLKTIGLLDTVKTNVRKWLKDVKQLTEIAGKRIELELAPEDIQTIAKEAIQFIKKSPSLEFLEDSNILACLNKDNKKECFVKITEVLADDAESLEKRKQAAEFLMKTKAIWSDITLEDTYEYLKNITKIKFRKSISDLKNKPKEIQDSWGFNDSTEGS